MLRRCYAQKKNSENHIKKVRFLLDKPWSTTYIDDHLSVRSARSDRSKCKKHKPLENPRDSSSTKVETTGEEDTNLTREDSTTHSEDKHMFKFL